MPPAVTIRKEDSEEMFFRRNIEIPSGSRCCNKHTINKCLLTDVFLSMVPQRFDYRIFSPQRILNVFESYRARLNGKKHLDFDEYTALVHFVAITSSQDTSSQSFRRKTLRRTFTSSQDTSSQDTSSQDTSSQKFFSVMFVAKQFHLFTKLTLFFLYNQ